MTPIVPYFGSLLEKVAEQEHSPTGKKNNTKQAKYFIFVKNVAL